MSTRRGQWIARRGQADVAAAIDQVIDQQPRPGEQVQEIPDELIEDSPYQHGSRLMRRAWRTWLSVYGKLAFKVC